MDPSPMETNAKVFNWLDGANKPRYSVTPSPGPGSQISHQRLIPYERQTEENLSPGPSQYWGNRTNVSRTENALSNAEPCPDMNGPTLVEIVGHHAEEMARRAPVPGSIYNGPRPSIRFGYPPGRAHRACFSQQGFGLDRWYRWDLQASAEAEFPDGTTRPLDLIDQHAVAAAVVYSQLDTNGRFAQGDMESLNQGFYNSLNGLYRGKHHDDEYIPTNEVDAHTNEAVVVATSRYRDRDGTQFTAAIQFVSPPPST